MQWGELASGGALLRRRGERAAAVATSISAASVATTVAAAITATAIAAATIAAAVTRLAALAAAATPLFATRAVPCRLPAVA